MSLVIFEACQYISIKLQGPSNTGEPHLSFIALLRLVSLRRRYMHRCKVYDGLQSRTLV